MHFCFRSTSKVAPGGGGDSCSVKWAEYGAATPRTRNAIKGHFICPSPFTALDAASIEPEIALEIAFCCGGKCLCRQVLMEVNGNYGSEWQLSMTEESKAENLPDCHFCQCYVLLRIVKLFSFVPGAKFSLSRYFHSACHGAN
jgi:hypothetical protein